MRVPCGELRKIAEIGAGDVAGGSAIEPRKPVPDIGYVADLAHLAIVDEVEPDVSLPGYHVTHGASDGLGEGRRIAGIGRSLFPPPQQREEIVGPGQASGVTGADAVVHGDHYPLPRVSSFVRVPAARPANPVPWPAAAESMVGRRMRREGGERRGIARAPA